MSDVDKIKTAVCQDDNLAFGFELSDYPGQLVAVSDYLTHFLCRSSP